MNDLDSELRRQLRSWDPAERLGDPHPRTVAEMRAALERAARGRRRFVPLLAVGALTAAVLGLLFFVPGDTPRPVLEAAGQPVNIAFTASNGVRVHWSVYPPSPAAGPRSLRSEERHESNR